MKLNIGNERAKEAFERCRLILSCGESSIGVGSPALHGDTLVILHVHGGSEETYAEGEMAYPEWLAMRSHIDALFEAGEVQKTG